MPAEIIRTVLGDISPQDLGRTNVHEHLLTRSPLLHVDRNPDPGLHAELAAAGVYLGYDGMARAKYWPDSVLLDCLLQVVARGGAERILLGSDVARRSSFRSYGGMPGLAYLPERFIPRLRDAGGEELVYQILVANPARFLAFTPADAVLTTPS